MTGTGCGLVVDPFDSGAISEAMIWLLNHSEEAEAMGQRGRDAVVAHYNWEQEAEELLELYNRLSVSK